MSNSWRSGRGLGIAAACGLLVAFSLGAAPSASAESTTSPTGLVAVSVPPVQAGVAATYTMTVTNTTSAPLQGIVASGSMPAGVTIKGIAGCARLGGNQSTAFLCSLPDLAPGASVAATFSLLASAAGAYDLVFSASGRQPVPGYPGEFTAVGDSATLSVNVQPGPTDLQVTGSSNNGSPNVGSTFTYTFQVKDNGPLPAAGVIFDDALPVAITLGTAVTTSTGTCTPNAATNSVHCDIGALNVGQQATIAISASATATGSFADTATVAAAGTDTHPANNSVTVTVQPR